MRKNLSEYSLFCNRSRTVRAKRLKSFVKPLQKLYSTWTYLPKYGTSVPHKRIERNLYFRYFSLVQTNRKALIPELNVFFHLWELLFEAKQLSNRLMTCCRNENLWLKIDPKTKKRFFFKCLSHKSPMINFIPATKIWQIYNVWLHAIP